MQFKPIAAVAVLLLVVASLLVAGCTSSTNSNQAASNASKTASSAATKTANTATNAASASTSIVPTAPPTPTVTPTPTPTPTPSPTIQVSISGPTTIHDGQGGKWTATVLVNGKALPQDQLTGKMNWFIDGKYHQTNTMTGATVNGAVMISDANGSETTWAPNGVHTLNAEYLGDPSLPNASITVTKVSP